MEFILNNWAEIALAVVGLFGTLTALTESTKDDNWVAIIKRILNAVILGRNK